MPSKFADEEVVYAKWPGSALYYKASVVSHLGNSKYDVKFESDDSVTTVATKDIMKEASLSRRSASRSPGRRSRSSSPGRRRRSRSPGRKVSPSRSPVAQKPRSPARKAKKVIESEKSPRIELERVPSEKSVVIEKAKQIMEELQNSNVEEVKGSSNFHITSVTQSEKSVTTQEGTSVTRRTTRSVTRALQKEDEPASEKCSLSSSKCCNIKSSILCSLCSLCSLIGYVAIMFIPLVLVFGFYLTCRSSRNCTFLKLPTIPPCDKFFNWKSTGYVFGWFLFQLGLSSLPLGRLVTGPTLPNGTKVTHVLNGFASFIISMATVGILYYYKKFPAKYIVTNYLSLATAAFLFAIVISVVTYILSRSASPKEPSGGILKDFFVGRITSPRVCPYVDLKLFAFKAGFITWCVMNIVYLNVDTIKVGWRKNISSIVLCVMQTAYIYDKLLFEEAQLYTSTLKDQKVGLMSMTTSFLVFPFFLSLQTRYLKMFPMTMPKHYYIIPVAIALIGFIIHRQSTKQKFEFRKNLKTAIADGVDYIPTCDGKGILCDGWWSKLRRPNYFGEILQALAWALVCGTQHFLPWLNLFMRVPMMLGVADEDNENCRKKYGQRWIEYESRVKYKVLPCIY